jgi:hypothetical protein
VSFRQPTRFSRETEVPRADLAKYRQTLLE